MRFWDLFFFLVLFRFPFIWRREFSNSFLWWIKEITNFINSFILIISDKRWIEWFYTHICFQKKKKNLEIYLIHSSSLSSRSLFRSLNIVPVDYKLRLAPLSNRIRWPLASYSALFVESTHVFRWILFVSFFSRAYQIHHRRHTSRVVVGVVSLIPLSLVYEIDVNSVFATNKRDKFREWLIIFGTFPTSIHSPIGVESVDCLPLWSVVSLIPIKKLVTNAMAKKKIKVLMFYHIAAFENLQHSIIL